MGKTQKYASKNERFFLLNRYIYIEAGGVTMDSCEEILIKLGILPNLVGYKYLVYSVELLMEDATRIQYVTKDLYPAVARYHGTNWFSVEHAIRTAITICWKRGNRQLLNRISSYVLHTKPTASEFIAILYEYCRLSASGA